jgi:hypothetical protein
MMEKLITSNRGKDKKSPASGLVCAERKGTERPSQIVHWFVQDRCLLLLLSSAVKVKTVTSGRHFWQL